MNTKDNEERKPEDEKEAQIMAALTKPLNRAIIIRKEMQAQFAADSRKSAPSRDRINQLKKYAKMIPFKKDEK